MDFSSRIKQVRQVKGLSLTDLGAALGKTESACRAWELGRTKPDADTLIKLAKYFDCSVDYLLGLSDAKNDAHAQRISLDDAEFREALNDYYDVRFRKGGRTAFDLLKDIVCSKGIHHTFMGLNEYLEFDAKGDRSFLVSQDIQLEEGQELGVLLSFTGMCAEQMFRELREKRWSEEDATPVKNDRDRDDAPKEGDTLLDKNVQNREDTPNDET